MKKSVLFLLFICTLHFVNGCGSGGASTPPPPPAAHFSVMAAAPSATAGTAFNFTVTALNASNVLVSGYGGTVRFSSSDAQAVLPANSTLTNGVGNFTATLKTSGIQTITATDTATSSITSTPSPTTVSAAATSQFSVTAPASANTGTAFNFSVTAKDPFSNTVSTYSGALHFTSSDAKAILPGNTTLTNGTGTFSATLNTAPNQTISATDTVMVSITGTSTSISVSSNGSSNLTITSGPLPPGTVGIEYGQPHGRMRITYFSFTAMGGTGALSWSWAAAPNTTLPPGLDCCTLFFGSPPGPVSRVDGAVNGVPTVAGTYHIVVTVKDSGAQAAVASANYDIVINYPPPPGINIAPPPAIGTLDSPYVGFTFTATDGFPPFAWSETGALPKGLDLSSSGVLSGKPTEAGTFEITVMVQDSLGRTAVPQDFEILVLSTGFTPSGSMGTARSSHTATSLNNGKVLVTGGVDVATAELFDPASGSFAPTGSMETERSSHTATLLSDGKVLVTGGQNAAGNALATAELFDPATGIFTPTGSMGIVRSSHTATLLNNGKVLVTGGQNAAGNVFATAELFDPATGIFMPTGSMGIARSYQTATLLNNGKVLVAGGGDVATAELFDPASDTFVPTGSMGTARFSHTATLLNDGKVLVMGGAVGGVALATAEIFDPANGSFAPTASMGAARLSHKATLLDDGKVLVTGGLENFFRMPALSEAELFDPASGTFSATADMTAARYSHTATLLTNGKVLVTGGLGSVVASFGPTLATAELYQ